MIRRILILTASVSAALSLALASSAYAGEDDTPPPPAAPPTQTHPPPPPPPPKPKPKHKAQHESGPSGESRPSQNTSSPQTTVQRPTVPTTSVVQAHPVTETQVSTVPRGGVQAGGGAMADDASHGALLGLGAGLMLLGTAGAGLTLRRRQQDA